MIKPNPEIINCSCITTPIEFGKWNAHSNTFIHWGELHMITCPTRSPRPKYMWIKPFPSQCIKNVKNNLLVKRSGIYFILSRRSRWPSNPVFHYNLTQLSLIQGSEKQTNKLKNDKYWENNMVKTKIYHFMQKKFNKLYSRGPV